MIQLNYRDARPIYEQIKDGLRHLMVTGAVQAGEQLPSVRALASSLAINPNTIQRAYEALEREGYLYTVAGKGSFAARQDGGNTQRRTELLGKPLRRVQRRQQLPEVPVQADRTVLLARAGNSGDPVERRAGSSEFFQYPVEGVEPHQRIGHPDLRIGVRHESVGGSVLRKFPPEVNRFGRDDLPAPDVDEFGLDALGAGVDSEEEAHLRTPVIPPSPHICRIPARSASLWLSSGAGGLIRSASSSAISVATAQLRMNRRRLPD